ncbi:cytochrome P450 [Jatrophihabitans lederbergiae]|uniref:Cytochrome P450 n=1 Tax=Jatrophihabitans lederbergiae TaxID=3075547 RepID=A0ABU2J7V6_9ACTN|nr:cytochrome P450 [Jatrophihabitans sp. DSM 44399]MDT0261072.1 cytochrome P450 [Jatrophihabitans sp. DSM 44399]
MTIAEEKIRNYPFEPFRGDLPDELLDMVRTQPVSRVRLPDGRVVWLVVGYDEAATVLADPRFTRHGRPEAGSCEQAGEPIAARTDPAAGCPVRARDLSMDGKPHTDLRRLAARAFTARRIEAYRPRVQAITDRLIDDMVATGQPADLVSGLVVPLPAMVVCEVLGVPVADRDKFAAWGNALLALTAHGMADTARADAELREYLTERLAEKRVNPGEDLLSSWIAAQTGSDELTDTEIVGLAIAVLIGGREISSTSAGIRALFQNPEALARLHADPVLLPAAVEEILRYTSVSPMFLVQTVTEELELGGVAMRAGDGVMAVPWAANRHPAPFPEPAEFNLDRLQNPHLTFGLGPHFCLGAALGRLQVEIAIGTLLRRLPNLAPAVPLDELPWRDERINCGLAEFPVTW